MKRKLLIATHNKAKIAEIADGIKTFSPNVLTVSLADFGITMDVEETGVTFEENARLKARFYADLLNLPTIADDGGIMIDALDGEPGVKTRRWLGYEMSDRELIEHTLKSLKNIPQSKRKAEFKAVLCYYNPKSKKEFMESAKVQGRIAQKANSTPAEGYPFRKIFILDGLNKYFSDITHEEHLQINHRFKALKRLMKKITTELL